MENNIWQTALILGVAFVLLFPIIKFLLKPVKLVVKLLVNGLTGFILLWLINTFGGLIGFFLPINLVTIVVAGFLGIPGILLLAFIKFLLMG